MTTIEIHTKINAPLEQVFDLSRSIDLHLQSAPKTQEQVISGKKSGLLGPGETITWRGKHFGVFLKHSSKITSFEKPFHFTDIMVKGHFTYFVHQHFFKSEGNHTLMTDILKYKVPYGMIGQWFNRVFLNKHLSHFLMQRNETIKKAAEKSPFHKKEAT